MGLPALDIPEAIAGWLKAQREQRDRGDRIYASDLGLALGHEHAGCQLAWWADFRGHEKSELTPGQLLLFQQGDNLHEQVALMLGAALEGTGWEVRKIEERTQLDHGDEKIGSRLDFGLYHTKTGYTVVMDVKTKRGAAFSYLDNPKPSDVLQVQGYVKAEDADAGLLLYVDREGQNFMKSFWVARQDERPERAIEILAAIRDSDTPPAPIPLKIQVSENKGADSVKLKEPWQMGWCNLKKCLCKHALPKANPPKKIVAKVKNPKDGKRELTFTDDGKGWEDVVFPLVQEYYPEEVVLSE